MFFLRMYRVVLVCLKIDLHHRRMRVVHTSETMHGQIYIPAVNWICESFPFGFAPSTADIDGISDDRDNHRCCNIQKTLSHSRMLTGESLL